MTANGAEVSKLSDQGFLELGDLRLEYRMTGPQPGDAPTLVLLHQGLGSATMWGDFPIKLAAATGFGVFAYSRVGYGHSSPAKLPRALDFMHIEAREILPRVLGMPLASGEASWSAIAMAPRSPPSTPAACRIIACAGW